MEEEEAGLLVRLLASMEAKSLVEAAANMVARPLARIRAVRVAVEADMIADREARLEHCDRPDSGDGHERHGQTQ